MMGEQRASNGAMWALGLGVTIVVHGLVVFLVFLSGSQASGHTAVEGPGFGQYVDVQAVRFGKPRDLTFLPHKAAAAAPRPKPAIKLTDNAAALPRLKDTPEDKPDDKPVDDPLAHARSLARQLNTDEGSTGTDEGEGDPNGLRGGTALVGKGPIYYQHLQAAVQNAWSVPTTISDEALAKMKAQACIKIDVEGKITEYRLSLPSGDERFDNTLLAAINSIKQFEPPTPDVRAQVTTDGVCMNFQKSR